MSDRPPSPVPKPQPPRERKPMKKVVAKNYKNVAAFHQKLRDSKRILAICGAGLSAASGLPTFRGPGGLWRNHKATELATPAAFARDPGLVWLFYAYVRRRTGYRRQPSSKSRHGQTDRLTTD